MKSTEKLLEIASKSTIPVLIQGESGVGKEVAARFLHQNGNRSQGPFVALNCGALAKNLLESILEGAQKGSYTGATDEKIGVVRASNGGTLFLDEIGELPLECQSRLLRILQERAVLPLGATSSIPVNFRLVCATNRNLKEEVSQGRFREDLFFRLNVFPITIPPLRYRKDFNQIAERLWEEHREQTLEYSECTLQDPLTGNELEMLKKYHWPGNIRQLKNVLHRYALLKDYDTSLGEILNEEFATQPGSNIYNLKNSMPEWNVILNTLNECHQNKYKAAKILGISRGGLYYQLKKHQEEWKEKGMAG
ncbi:MAG: sigma-54-dependent Fis family transcriptional regulator [Fibrobacteraceae bacterium]|nr:sigma-54-dependent Fis family transcriptional regulator [Fibrobacteraceae bacterium]